MATSITFMTKKGHAVTFSAECCFDPFAGGFGCGKNKK